MIGYISIARGLYEISDKKNCIPTVGRASCIQQPQQFVNICTCFWYLRPSKFWMHHILRYHLAQHCIVEQSCWYAKLKHWEGQKGLPFRVRIFASFGVERDSSLIIVAYGTWIWPISKLKAKIYIFFWLEATKFWPSGVDGSYCWTFYFVLYTYSLFSVIYYCETLQLMITPIPSLVSNSSVKLQLSITTSLNKTQLIYI